MLRPVARRLPVPLAAALVALLLLGAGLAAAQGGPPHGGGCGPCLDDPVDVALWLLRLVVDLIIPG